MRKGQITLNLNAEFRKIVKQRFNTEDETKIKQLILEFLENGESPNLSLQDKMLIERIAKIREQRPLQLEKLRIQNEILQKKRDFLYNFKREISESGSQILTKSTCQKYGFGGSQNIQENIQLKKNFYINKIQDGEYCGCCKVCGNFSTAICTTSKEAEGDVELHLEAVHKSGLFQR